MDVNPYQPPDANEVIDVDGLHPVARDTCPVCLNTVSRWKLFWRSSADCSRCSTSLTLAQPPDSKPGLGCIVVAGICIAIVSYSVMNAIKHGVSSLPGLIILLPLFASYGACVRWFTGLPYPSSLLVLGRIPANDQTLAESTSDAE